MAVTKFVAPLILLLALSNLAKKWNDSVGKRCWRDQWIPIPTFKFSVPLSQEESICFGYELVGRWIHTRQADDMHFGRSLLGQMLLLLGGDIEVNPGDRGSFCGICLKQEDIQNQACNVVNVMGYFTPRVVKFKTNTNDLSVLIILGFARSVINPILAGDSFEI